MYFIMLTTISRHKVVYHPAQLITIACGEHGTIYSCFF